MSGWPFQPIPAAIPSAAGGGGFNAAWAANANIVIGSGGHE